MKIELGDELWYMKFAARTIKDWIAVFGRERAAAMAKDGWEVPAADAAFRTAWGE